MKLATFAVLFPLLTGCLAEVGETEDIDSVEASLYAVPPPPPVSRRTTAGDQTSGDPEPYPVRGKFGVRVLPGGPGSETESETDTDAGTNTDTASGSGKGK